MKKMKTTSTSTQKVRTHKPAIHYTEQYLINPAHPVTVNVIGCGGTGSQVLNSLARMSSALKTLGHTGLFVRAIDPDRVTVANMGRQLFSPADVGDHKASVLIGRINRFFGTDWESQPCLYNAKADIPTANITISCVDTGKARKEIKEILLSAKDKAHDIPDRYRYGGDEYLTPYQTPYYWLDYGNMKDRGQCVLGTVRKIGQPKDAERTTVGSLPTVDKLFPDIFKDNKDDDQGPSCSLAEALDKQDLFINTNLANAGLGILWKMFRETRIKYHGLFMNLETLTTNPIIIKPKTS